MLRQEPLEERDVQEILSRAAEIEGRESYDLAMLERTAAELGISVESVRLAEAEHRATRGERRLKEEFIQSRKEEFKIHLVTYVSVNVFLHLLNFFTSRGDSSPTYWAIFPLLGWGIGIAIHYFTARLTTGATFDEEFQKWKADRLAKKIIAGEYTESTRELQ